MRGLLFTLLLGACTFERPADVTFGNAAITITEGDRQTGVVDTRLPLSLKVNVTDADFLPIENFTVEFTVRDGNGTFVEDNRDNEKSMDEVRTDAQGNARIDLRMGTRSGEIVVDVSGEGIEGNEPVFFTHTALADVPVQISAYAGNGESATVATQLAAPLVARVEDRFGNPSPAGVEVTFAVASGSGTLATPTGTSAADGTVSSLITLGTAAGPTTIEATASGLTPATFTVNGLADVAVSMERVSPATLLAEALRPSEEMIVLARDTYGNPAPGASITFTRTGGTANPAGTVTNATVVTDANGRAVGTIVAASLAGTNIVTANGAGLTGGGFTFTATTRSVLAAQSLTLTGKVGPIAIGDINTDGRDDLVVLTQASSPSFQGFTVYLNTTPAGATTVSFDAGTRVPTGSVSSSARVSLADMNGDGAPDVLFSYSSDAMYLNTTASGATAPTFANPVSFSGVGGRPLAADINGDQLVDIVIVGSSTRTCLRTAGGGFANCTPMNSLSETTRLVDMNGDGKPDITSHYSQWIMTYLNTSPTGGAASFATNATNAQVTITPFYENYGSDLADINGDAKPDWLLSSTSSLRIMTSASAAEPSYVTLPDIASGTFYRPTFVDMNGDGLLDILGTTGGSMRALLNTGTATAPAFAPVVDLPASLNNTYTITVADLNGDGRPDYVGDYTSSSTTPIILGQ